MRNKYFFAFFFVISFLFFDCSGAFAFFGQLETKKERLARERDSGAFSPDAYEKIQESFFKEDYDSAVKLAENYLWGGRNRPDAEDVLYLESLSLLKLGRVSEAREKLEELQNSARSEELKVSAAVSLGDSYFFEKDYAAAFQRYETAVNKYPRSAETPYVLYQLAETCWKLGKLEEVNEYKQRLVKEYAATPQAREAVKNFSSVGPAVGMWRPSSLHQMSVEESPFYTVQVGSFSRERNARALVQKLSRYKYDAYIDAHAPERMFRVRVGKMSSREDALALETRLKKDGYPTKIYP